MKAYYYNNNLAYDGYRVVIIIATCKTDADKALKRWAKKHAWQDDEVFTFHSCQSIRGKTTTLGSF